MRSTQDRFGESKPLKAASVSELCPASTRTANIYIVPEDTEMIEYESKSFLAKVFELNKVMWSVNAGLSASHKFASRPKVIDIVWWPRRATNLLCRIGLCFAVVSVSGQETTVRFTCLVILLYSGALPSV